MDHLRRYSLWYCAALLLAVNALIWYAILLEGRRELRVTFLNVGQGDAIFIEAPGGRQMLVDGGPDRSVLRELRKVMPFFDRSIDVVLLSHPDKDHVAGLIPVLERFDVDYILDPGVAGESGYWGAFAEAAPGRVAARRGMTVHLGEGADFHILFPDRDLSGVSDTNTASIVGQLRFGESEFLFTGDAPLAIEQYLVSEDGAALGSDVLKAGHHGSRTSSGEEFLAAVRPAYIIFSAEKDSRYGHPHEETVARAKAVGARLLGTYEEGAVTFVSDGRALQVR